MGVSKRQAVENIDAATRLFRERSLEAVGLNELMAAAGFTRGHFGSKDDLVAAVMVVDRHRDDARLRTKKMPAAGAGGL